MQDAEVIGVQGGAAIAQVIQVIADRLIGHDEPDGLPMAITGQETVNAAALAVKCLGGDARQGLLLQLRAGNLPGPIDPVLQVLMHLGTHLQEYLRRHGQNVGRRRHPGSPLPGKNHVSFAITGRDRGFGRPNSPLAGMPHGRSAQPARRTPRRVPALPWSRSASFSWASRNDACGWRNWSAPAKRPQVSRNASRSALSCSLCVYARPWGAPS